MLPSLTITRVDQPTGRHYQVEGYDELFPSVTTVLGVISKPGLVPWARNVALDSVRAALTERIGGTVSVTPKWIEEIITEGRNSPDRVRDEAADFGTQAHILIDAIIQGEAPDIPQEMVPVVNNFLGWRQHAGLDIQLTETIVYSAKYRYAGAMDALAYRDGHLVALDWKTGRRIYGEARLQIAAYAKALEEMTGNSIQEAWVVRFGKVIPEFEAMRVEDLNTAFIAFRAALYLWRALQAGSA